MRSRSTLSALCLGLLLSLLGAGASAQALDDIWEGKLKVGAGMEMRLVFHVAHLPDRSLRATMDSPDQGATGIKADGATLSGGTLTLTFSGIRGAFSGKLDAAGTTAIGEWTQSGAKLPLVLHKTDRPSEVRRPQTPRPPLPYRAEEALLDSKAAGVHLAGTLTVPPGAGPFPAVLLLTGSGAQDRDETLLGHKPFAVLADALTRRGVVVLRLDDRGVGGSTGTLETATSEDLAGDALAGVAWLKARKEVDPRRIGLLGHSEGGLIAPMAAVRSKDIAFLVLVAGPGVPGDQLILRQVEVLLRQGGAGEDVIRARLDQQRRIFAVVRSEKDPAVAAKRVRALIEESLASLPEAERREAQKGAADQLAAQVLSPWFRFFVAYDPRPTLAKVRCPVLALNGERDTQVAAKENLAAIAKALGAGGNRRAITRELPGLNHLLQTAKTGSPAEYASIEETMAPAALAQIGDWILKP